MMLMHNLVRYAPLVWLFSTDFWSLCPEADALRVGDYAQHANPYAGDVSHSSVNRGDTGVAVRSISSPDSGLGLWKESEPWQNFKSREEEIAVLDAVVPERVLASAATPSPAQTGSTSAPNIDPTTPSPIIATTNPVVTAEPTVLASSTDAPIPEPTMAPGVSPTAAGTTLPPVEADSSSTSGATSQSDEDEMDGETKVKNPYFMEKSDDQVNSATLHIRCDTEGATIHYTLEDEDPTENSQTPDSAGRVVVNEIGTHVIRAIGMKEGMENSDVVNKTFTVEEQVADPKFTFHGQEATGYDNLAFVRWVDITMNCDTENVTIFFTTDGSTPVVNAPFSASPGYTLTWSKEGTTTFKAVAFADDDKYESSESTYLVTIVAPRLDEHNMTAADGDECDIHPQVEVTTFEMVFPPPDAELEQQEQMGPGYASSCDQNWRVVRGKLVRLMNPRGHFNFLAPDGACGDPGDSSAPGVLALASETARTFEPTRMREAVLQEGESPEQARTRLRLDEREAEWRAAQGLGCQVVAASGLLGPPGGPAECVGHLVTDGHVQRADSSTGLVSFGVRNGTYVVGMVTNEEVRNETNPFDNLVSGAGWLVRSGINHVDASARDGHLDILRDYEAEDRGAGQAADMARGEGLDDVLEAKLARTALGYDSEGRLILLQTSGAATGSDQDAAFQDGLDLYELADVMIEAGAVNAINLVGGGPAAMAQNFSAIVDPTGDCDASSGVDEGTIGFGKDSTLARCGVPVSSIVCMHVEPPPLVPGYTGTEPPVEPDGGCDQSSGGGTDESRSSEEESWDASEGPCTGNFSGNSTLFGHLMDAEEAVFRYKTAFWVVTVLGMVSLYFNIQHRKMLSSLSPPSSQGGGAVSGYEGHIGNIEIMSGTKSDDHMLVSGVELTKTSGKRGSRSGKSKRKSSTAAGRGGYAPVNGDYVEGDMSGAQAGAGDLNGFYAESGEEEIDLGLIRPRGSSWRKREKSKGGRLKRALTKVAKAATGGEDPVPSTATARGASDSNSDSDMAINPFMGTGGGQRRQSQGGGGKGGGRDGYKEAGSWA